MGKRDFAKSEFKMSFGDVNDCTFTTPISFDVFANKMLVDYESK